MKYNSIEYIPKIEPESLEVLSLIYTPGVGHACMKIKDDVNNSFLYTNRSNSIAVLSFDYEQSLKRAIFLKDTLNIDAYPLEMQNDNADILKLVVENISPNFCGVDLRLIAHEIEEIRFDVDIPVLINQSVNIKEFFNPVSKNILMFKLNMLKGDFKEQSLSLRERAGGVIETELSQVPQKKPVAIVSDGSAVLGFGNIGPEAGLPVMEGKAVIFKSLGSVNAIPLCLKTQKPEEIIKIVQALKNSFSGINLEDISAPRCFDIEKELIETLDIPVFHDDQHGTAIVVLAALLNALKVAGKNSDKVKIVISGAGAAAQAVSKLLLTAGAKDIIHTNKKGIVHKDPNNEVHLQELAQITNKQNLEGTLEDALEGADIFIGLSAPEILKKEWLNVMAKKPIIFALANPIPEIMPDEAKEAGAFIVATGRSDFDNQINNSLAFPGLFRGILDNNINKITNEIKFECANAIASLIKEKDLSPINILPNALDVKVVEAIRKKLEKFKK
ncbi:MAG: NADP-dependent malic enzyme [Candidatus Gastranaerophilales bacterium]|nr:NADP-dependent malic enzyme [Candidatus Gastranaerophilales bacterium]